MKFKLAILFTLVFINSESQKFDGFVITTKDSLFKGYMKISIDGSKGRKILITDDKKKKPKSYHLTDLKYYSYKNDTFAMLRNFYPFEDDGYQIESVEAKVIISKGAIKVYFATLPEYKDTVIPIIIPTGTGVSAIFVRPEYATYILKDRENNLKALRKEKGEFEKSIEIIIGEDNDLMNQVRNKHFKFKDTEEIIRIYNSRVK